MAQSQEFQALFESMTEGLILQDSQGRVIAFNRAALEILGVSEGQLRGTTSMDPRWKAIHGDGTPCHRSDTPANLVLRTGKEVRGRLLGMSRPNGEIRWVTVNAVPIFEQPSDTQCKVLVTFADVTEQRVLTEQKLRVKERLKIAAKTVNFGVWDWDCIKDTLVWDDQMHEIYGIPKSNRVNRFHDYESYLLPEDVHLVKAALSDAFSIRGNFSAEFRIIKNGEIRIIRGAATCYYDEKGSVIRLVGANWDITEEKQRDSDIKKALKELDRFFSISLDFLGIFDERGKFRRINQELLSALGWSSEQTSAHYLWDCLHPDDIDATQKKINTLKSGASTVKFENRLRDHNHHYRTLSWVAARSDEDGLTYFAARDVTEDRKRELRMINASKMSSLGEMSAGIAHEIKNPLAIIKVKTHQILLATKKLDLSPAEIKSHSESINGMVNRISSIIDGLRAFARDGEHDPMEPCLLQSIVEDTIDLCLARFQNQKIAIRVLPYNQNIKINCRKVQLSQVFLNLFNNAYDAVAELNERWVEVQIIEQSDRIEIGITDSGKLVDTRIRDKMFDPFFTTKSATKGTGLGLSISQGIIKSHGGQFFFDEQSPNTRFLLSFPAEPSKEC